MFPKRVNCQAYIAEDAVTAAVAEMQRQFTKQEAQLMPTNLCDAFGGQSRSPNIVPFHMLGVVSYCAIVTLSLFDFKKCSDLEMGSKFTQGH